MIFKLSKASDRLNEESVEINSIEELAALDHKYGDHGLHMQFIYRCHKNRSDDKLEPEIVVLDDFYE